MEKDAKIYVAGHNGLLGSAIKRRLERDGFSNIICRSSSELDLRNQSVVEDFFRRERPEYVFDAAAKVGGIQANMNFGADFIYDNLQIQTNLIHFSYKYGVKKFVFFGTNCMYPKDYEQPMKEEDMLSGAFEPTNEPYAVAKVAGFKMCQAYRKQYGCDFISIVPASLYGPYDNFDAASCHLIPALIRKFHDGKVEGKEFVELWGTGKPRREFLFIDDVADAVMFLVENYKSGELINVGYGEDYSILEIANIVKEVVGFKGEIRHDLSKPDGMMRKFLDSGKMKGMGWEAKTNLRDGVRKTYEYFLENEIFLFHK
ncbi:MAG: GDP-L-fucose synthase [Nanoarchaeota archaeon]|nr:GDP-L-fucose synthase [Nanoarchaeota archaeon]